MRFVAGKSPITRDVDRYIQQNKAKFKGQILGPLLLHVRFMSQLSSPEFSSE